MTHISGGRSDKSQPFAILAVNETVQNHLGEKLRDFFGPVEDEPLPENLRRLIQCLEDTTVKTDPDFESGTQENKPRR